MSPLMGGVQGAIKEPVVIPVPYFCRLPASGDLGKPLLAKVEFHKMCLALCLTHTQ